MTWKLRQISDPQVIGYKNLQPGDWWYCPWLLEDQGEPCDFLSVHYKAERAAGSKRPPVIIRLPDGWDWLMDQPSSNGTGWKVSGEEGLWTASPSILSSGYHGWLNDGILSADTDGRTYV